MAYRLVYQATVCWVGPGMGPMGNAPGVPLGLAPTGNAQTLDFFNSGAGQNTGTFTSGDITTLTNGMAADLAAQMNAQIGRVQAFATGGS